MDRITNKREMAALFKELIYNFLCVESLLNWLNREGSGGQDEDMTLQKVSL